MPTRESISGRRPRKLIHLRTPTCCRSWTLQAEDRFVFLPQVHEKRPVVERLSRDPPTEVRGPVALAVPVDLFAEPVLEPAEITAAEVVVETGQVASGGGHELGGVEVAKRVSREVAQAAKAPVDVLQTAAGVVRRRQAEQFAEPLVPRGRHVRRCEVAS